MPSNIRQMMTQLSANDRLTQLRESDRLGHLMLHLELSALAQASWLDSLAMHPDHQGPLDNPQPLPSVCDRASLRALVTQHLRCWSSTTGLLASPVALTMQTGPLVSLVV